MTSDEQRPAPEGSGDRSRQPEPRDDGLTVGQWRLRYILVAVVTVVWVVDIAAVLLGSSDAPQPTINGIFLVVVAWVLGIEYSILSLFRKD